MAIYSIEWGQRRVRISHFSAGKRRRTRPFVCVEGKGKQIEGTLARRVVLKRRNVL